MTAKHAEIQKTHFADDDTLAYISRLERDRAELIEALRELHNQFDGMAEYQKEQEYSEAEMVQMFQVIANRARALLSRLGAE